MADNGKIIRNGAEIQIDENGNVVARPAAGQEFIVEDDARVGTLEADEATVSQDFIIDQNPTNESFKRWAGWEVSDESFVWFENNFTDVDANSSTVIHPRETQMGANQVAVTVTVHGRVESSVYWLETVSFGVNMGPTVHDGSTIEQGSPPSRSYSITGDHDLELNVGDNATVVTNGNAMRAKIPEE